MKTKHVAIYARVSKDDKERDPEKKKKPQDPENQLRDLRTWCKRAGYVVAGEYVEHVSGRKGAESRKELARLLEDANQRKFDLVLFWSLDRFSREGMRKTVSYLQRLDAAGVAFHSYTEPWLQTDNEMVRDILMAVMTSFAKQEAIRISERTKAGLERARAAGTQLGRPQVADKALAAVRKLHKAEPQLSQRALAERLGVTRGTVRKAL